MNSLATTQFGKGKNIKSFDQCILQLGIIIAKKTKVKQK